MATPTQTAVYVYGIVPSDVELDEPTAGVGEPASQVRLVRHRDIAALISDVEDSSRPLGTPEDLMAHEQLLDASAAAAPVLPMRFGAVVASEEAVEKELLAPHHKELSASLQELEGLAEYVVKGRYAQDAVLREILSLDREAAELAAQTRGQDPLVTRDAQIQLGEVISERLADQRARDTRQLGDALAGRVTASVVRPPAEDFDAVHVAFLADASQAEEVMAAAGRLADEWGGRIDVRVIGPLAPYDFTGSVAPDSAGPPADG
jgi:hypothetical protein